MFCVAKLPFLFSILFYLLSGNDNFSEELREKSEKIRVQKETTTFFKKIVVSFWRRRMIWMPLIINKFKIILVLRSKTTIIINYSSVKQFHHSLFIKNPVELNE
jgi:hypothetical protein